VADDRPACTKQITYYHENLHKLPQDSKPGINRNPRLRQRPLLLTQTRRLAKSRHPVKVTTTRRLRAKTTASLKWVGSGQKSFLHTDFIL